MARSSSKKRAKRGAPTARDRTLGEIRAAIARARAGRWGAKDAFSGINTYRESLPLSAVAQSVATLTSHPAYVTAVWPSPFPRKWSEFSERTFRAYLEFEFELEWTAHALLAHAPKLNKFLEMKAEFDAAILASDAIRANSVLDIVEEEFGLSVWLAEARLAHLQLTAGFKAQKDFVRQLTTQTNSSLVRFLIAWIALKYEENTSYAQLMRMIDRFAGQEFGLYYLLRLSLGGFTVLSPDMAGRTLSHADTLPVIDRYLTFLKVVQAALTSSTGEKPPSDNVRRSLLPLAKAITDNTLRRTYFASGGVTKLNQFRPSFSSALDEYTMGNYQASDAACEVERVNYPSSIAPLVLQERSRTVCGDSAATDMGVDTKILKLEIGLCLAEIFRFGPRAVERRQRLQKIGVVHANCEWSAGIRLLVPPEADLRDDDLARRRACYLALQSSEDHPLLAGSLSLLVPAERYLIAIDPESSVTSKLMKVAYGTTTPVSEIEALGVPENRVARYKAIAHICRGENAEALPILESIFNDTANTLDRLGSSDLLVTALLRENELGAAADVAASLLLTSPYFASILPLSKLVSAIVEAQEEGDPRAARGNLSVAIVADMYSRYIAPDQEMARSDAYKDFLRANGVRRPTELSAKVSEFPKKEIIYFLRNVCVPEVMDQSLALPSTVAVEDERVGVLLMLAELVPDDDRDTLLALFEELREIRTRQVVRDTNTRLEQSKIFVNVEGIKKRVDASIKDSWDRYRLLSLQNDETDIISEVRRILEKRGSGKVIALQLSLPETERSKIFQQMVVEIRDLFVDSKEFGLDANLSANIRHGYVLREIRSPLLAQNLITNRPELDQPYEENRFWRSRLFALSAYEHRLLQKALADFSAEVDGKIEALNGQVLRINSLANPDGMFRFGINAPQISLLEQKSETLDNHEDFIQLVVDHFWQATDYNLDKVRKHLMESALQGFSDALDGLDKALDSVADSSKLINLRSAIALSRPELQAAIGRVASWFTLSTDIDFPDYSVETAYQAGIETIKSYAANVEIKSTLTCDNSVFLRGRTLPFIGRIFFIILDNIVEHSHIATGEIKVHCSIRLDGAFIVIKIVSDLGVTADLAAVSQRAEEVNEQYGTEKATQFISVERRSGYPKIWKILTHDLQVEHLLEVSVDENDRKFSVEIMMAAAGITVRTDS